MQIENVELNFQETNWSGTWTSRSGRDVEILRNVHGTARGWDGFVEALSATRGYSIAISQTATDVVVTFPGGAGNMLTIPGFPVAAESSAKVVNRGEWWTKHVTAGRWVGGALELTSTTFSGWWRNVPPDRAQPRPTDFRMRLTFSTGASPDQLFLRVLLSDEKGELEYLQTFYREP